MKKEDFYLKSVSRNVGEGYPKYRYILSIIKHKTPKTFLDIGCGDGAFLDLVKQTIPGVDAKGIEISKNITHPDVISLNIDDSNMPFSDNQFDFIFCGELIEHLYDPDHLLEEIKRVLSSDGLCVLTTLNLAFWLNRLSLLFGFQPFGTEVSTKYRVGYFFDPCKNGTDALAGHLRLFTYRSILELIRLHGLHVLATKGYGVELKQMWGRRGEMLARVLNFIFPLKSTSFDILIVFSKNKEMLELGVSLK